jgi:glycyl-tRNA synthetase
VPLLLLVKHIVVREVLVMVMRKHQRYFPVFSSSSGSSGNGQQQQQLLPAFITVANGPVDPTAVAGGNEAVLRARFEDAAFFYNEDQKQQLADFRWAELLIGRDRLLLKAAGLVKAG